MPNKKDDFSIDLSNISQEILENTAAICIVHHNGSAVSMENIIRLEKQYNFSWLKVRGSVRFKFRWERVGTFDDMLL